MLRPSEAFSPVETEEVRLLKITEAKCFCLQLCSSCSALCFFLPVCPASAADLHQFSHEQISVEF